MEKKIVEVLKELGVPMGNLGFKYIREAVLLIDGDESWLDGITKPGGLYYTVANTFGTAASRVERAIRHAIEQSFLHINTEILQKYFGNTPDLSSGKMTNRNFLAALVYAINEDEISSAAPVEELATIDTDKSCTCCGSESKLIKVDQKYLCLVCLHKANLSLTEDIKG